MTVVSCVFTATSFPGPFCRAHVFASLREKGLWALRSRPRRRGRLPAQDACQLRGPRCQGREGRRGRVYVRNASRTASFRDGGGGGCGGGGRRPAQSPLVLIVAAKGAGRAAGNPARVQAVAGGGGGGALSQRLGEAGGARRLPPQRQPERRCRRSCQKPRCVVAASVCACAVACVVACLPRVFFSCAFVVLAPHVVFVDSVRRARS